MSFARTPLALLGIVGLAAFAPALASEESRGRMGVVPGAQATAGKGGSQHVGIACGTNWYGRPLTYSTRANVNFGNLTSSIPWNIQMNGEVLGPSNQWVTPGFPLQDTGTVIPIPGVTASPNTFPGTRVVVPFRVCRESWFGDPVDPDVIPPLDNADPPFPGFPFEGMELSAEEEALIFEAMGVLEAASTLRFVEIDPVNQSAAFPRGVPTLLFVKGADAEEPFGAQDFINPEGASFSISVGMVAGPLVMASYDPTRSSLHIDELAIPSPLPASHFLLMDEEEIPQDDMGNYAVLPGYNAAAFPGIPVGRLPLLDHEDVDNDGVAADLGDFDNPGVMYVDWEPRPLVDRRVAGSPPMLDVNGIEDANGDGNYFDNDGNTQDVDGDTIPDDQLEGMVISPFTALVVMHPDALEDGGLGTRSVIIHEIMHALGFYHEQQRADREAYVEILEENVAGGQLSQFELALPDSLPDNLVGVYDFESIMHYGPLAFSFDGVSETIRVRPQYRARYGEVIGAATNLSKGDARGLRALYGNPDCPADFNGDNQVDSKDLNIFIVLFTSNDPAADVNGDLIVNINDFFEFLDAFAGRRCFAPPPVPVVRPAFAPSPDPF